MNQQLAEKILTNVMGWDEIEVKENVRMLENFAELKYDQYQRYEAGNRFIEKLAIWLNQFEKEEEKNLAFDFIKNNLIFISEEEMYHLIRSIYPDYMKPIMKRQAKEIYAQYKEDNTPNIGEILEVVSRQSLIFGLSDGARLDIFRRSDAKISNEQVCISYEIPETKYADIASRHHPSKGWLETRAISP